MVRYFIMKIVSGFQNTRKNKEDFAITPYLFGVWIQEEIIKVYGMGLCWGFYSIYIGIGFNIPKGYGGFRVIS